MSIERFSRFNSVASALAAVLCLLQAAAPLHLSAGPNWPQFRGPGSRGISDEKNLPDAWSTTENVVWKIPIPGRGWSSPVVWGNKIFLTSTISEGNEEEAKKGLYFGGDRPTPPPFNHRWITYCIETIGGKILWEKTALQQMPGGPRHIKNSYASETPTTDGERVYAYFGNAGLFAYTVDGEPVWSKKFDSRKIRNGWGTAASPVVFKDAVYIVNDNEEESFLAAFDKKTGAELWKTPRSEKSNWATPFIWENDQRAEIVTSGSGKVRSYDLGGKLLWELAGMSVITIPTPFAHDKLLYLGSGYVMDQNRPMYAIRPGASGDISLKPEESSSKFIAWRQSKAAPYNPTPVLYDGRLYVLLDRGFFACYDAASGEEIYSKQRLGPDANAFTASPWAYEGKIFCLSEDGVTFVVQSGPVFKVMRQNNLDELCMGTPAIADGNLYIRTLSRLYCIRKPKS